MVIKELRSVPVKKLLKKTRLIGGTMGSGDYGRFAVESQGHGEKAICFDWSGIELATGSYLKAAYLPIFRPPRGLPMFTSGMNAETREELELALQTESRPIFILEAQRRGRPVLSLAGYLDDAYLRTMTALGHQDAVSPAELYKASLGDTPQIGKTAWINRLTRMYEMGLISRTKAGKGYQYSNINI